MTSISLAYSLGPFDAQHVLYAISSLIPPFALGIAQWVVLRDLVERSRWWIPATAVALWLPVVVFAVLPAGMIGGGTGFILSYPIGGLLYGILTLIVLNDGAEEAAAA